MKLSIVFPAYNEESVLGKTLQDAVEYLDGREEYIPYEIIVVDNASQDRTPEVVTAFACNHSRVRLIRQPRNLGYAMSNLTAFREAKGDVVVVVDGDGQLTLEDLPHFLEKIQQGFPVVYGWRRRRRDPWARKLVSFLLNILSWQLLDWPHHDINCGYRVVTRHVAKEVQQAAPSNFWGPELWVIARKMGWPVGEIAVRHFPRLGGQSIHSFRRLPAAMLECFRHLLRLRKALRQGPDGHAIAHAKKELNAV